MNKKKETHLKVADSLDKPRSNSVFKRRAKDTIKIVLSGLIGYEFHSLFLDHLS